MDYIGTKIIAAMQMRRAGYNLYRGWDLPANEHGDDEGFLVEYRDGGPRNDPRHAGYISWSPKEVFEHSYQPVTAMSFGHALVMLQAGKRVARAGWNGKGMWLTMVRDWNGNFGGNLPETWWATPFIALKSVGDGMVPWLASQTDQLANDWMVV